MKFQSFSPHGEDIFFKNLGQPLKKLDLSVAKWHLKNIRTMIDFLLVDLFDFFFFAEMSSSRSDDVNKLVCLCVCSHF